MEQPTYVSVLVERRREGPSFGRRFVGVGYDGLSPRVENKIVSFLRSFSGLLYFIVNQVFQFLSLAIYQTNDLPHNRAFVGVSWKRGCSLPRYRFGMIIEFMARSTQRGY
eukprot:scaffold825_cov196-Alexandrium_tamarense.AAC.15